MSPTTRSQSKVSLSNQVNNEGLNKILLNDLILDMIFSNFGVSDLKSCRLVCRKWKGISNRHFARSVTCSIGSYHSKRLKQFEKDFGNPSEYKFTKFRFNGEHSAHELETFFSRGGYNVSELELLFVNLTDRNGKVMDSYNVSNWNTLNLASLRVHTNDLPFAVNTTFCIHFGTIGSVNILFLKGNSIKIVFNGIISPTNLHIENCNIRDYGNVLNNAVRVININDHVTVGNVQELTWHNMESIKICLDVASCLRLEHLKLSNVKVTGWHNAMILKRLHIGNVTLKLSALPPSVEKLAILQHHSFSNDYLTNTEEEVFPHFKYLSFEEEPLQFYSQCQNLMAIKIKSGSMDLNTLPLSVQTIHTNVNCLITGNRTSPLSKLVFYNSFNSIPMPNTHRWKNIEGIISRCKPKTIVFCSSGSCAFSPKNHKRNSKLYGITNIITLTDIYETIQKQVDAGGTVFWGRLGSGTCSIRNSPINTTDPKMCSCKHEYNYPVTDYFLFANGVTRTISKQEFDRASDDGTSMF